MPRSHYVDVTRKDKLHRKEKDEMRAEKIAAEARAAELARSVKESELANAAHSLPFHIARTGTKNLPVYEDTKNGGSKQVTILRKLSGDLVALQKALQQALKLPESYLNVKGQKRTPVEINRLTQQISIQGRRGAEVRQWAQAVGF